MLIFLSFRTETNLIQVTNFKRNVVKCLLRVLFIDPQLSAKYVNEQQQLDGQI